MKRKQKDYGVQEYFEYRTNWCL